MTHSQPNWDDLTISWREQAPAPPHAALLRRARTHTLLMWLVTLTELGLLFSLAVFSRWYLTGGAIPSKVALLVILWTVTIAIAGFAIWNRHGSWRADSETTEAYLDLTERRARAKVRVARFIRAVTGVQAALAVALVWANVAASGAPSASRVLLAGFLAAFAAASYCAWSVWYERRAREEIAEVAAARGLFGSSM